MRTQTLVPTALCVLATTVVGHAGQAVSLRAVRQTPSTFSQTENGDWRTTIPATDSVPTREFVYVPPTKIEPMVSVRLRFNAQAGPKVHYAYQIANGVGARQQLARLLIGTRQVVALDGLPDGWRHHEPQRPGAVSLAGPLVGDTPSGLAPGATPLAIELSGETLPGVVTIRAAGNTSGAVKVPPGLSEQQRAELLELSSQATVDVPAIGPAIPGGVGEPELGFDVLLSRVGLHYAGELTKSRHPQAEQVVAILERMNVEGAAVGDTAVQDGLAEIQRLAASPVGDPWHAQISSALEVCARALASGLFPVR